ncbi:MAG: FeoC-like transcriptional regulator [Anaerolineae bacterium]
MLIRLLRAISEAKGSTNQAELARKLDVSEALLTSMIFDLVRLGYLDEVRPGCAAGTCSGCSAHKVSACGEVSKAKLWSLTAMGQSAANKTG